MSSPHFKTSTLSLGRSRTSGLGCRFSGQDFFASVCSYLALALALVFSPIGSEVELFVGAGVALTLVLPVVLVRRGCERRKSRYWSPVPGARVDGGSEVVRRWSFSAREDLGLRVVEDVGVGTGALWDGFAGSECRTWGALLLRSGCGSLGRAKGRDFREGFFFGRVVAG